MTCLFLVSRLIIESAVLLIFNVLYFVININNPEVIIVIYYNIIIQFEIGRAHV